MHPSAIKAGTGPGAWLITKDDVYRFDDIDDPNDGVMSHIYELGGIIVTWDGAKAAAYFNIKHCRVDGLSKAVRHDLYPLTLRDVSGQAPFRKARNREEGEAICADFIMYKSLSFVDKTVVIDRPETQIAGSSDLIQSTVEAWRGNADYQWDKLIELIPSPGGYVIGIVGNQSLAAQHLGVDWAVSMRGTPALPECPSQYEKAVFNGYKHALDVKHPILQDVHAKIETDDGLISDSYRRLIIPILADGSDGVLLVASEGLQEFSTSFGLPE